MGLVHDRVLKNVIKITFFSLLGFFCSWFFQHEARGAELPKSIMNPHLDFNGLMLYRNSNRGNYIDSTERNGFFLQEGELGIFADVDAYTKMKVNLSIHQEAPSSGNREGDWKVEPEEIFIDTTQIPSLTLRAGKFKGALGKHNLLHTHAFPFIDAPIINSVLLGGEGLNDVGLSASYLASLPWFSELTLQIVSGRPETADAGGSYFNSGSSNSSAYIGHFKNLWDLSDSSTLEAGLSGATGTNEFADAGGVNRPGATDFYGADLTFKWRPVEGGKKKAIVWATEYLSRKINRPISKSVAAGVNSSVQCQFKERWWVQLRGEYFEATDNAASPLAIAPVSRKYSALLAFLPSEFSSMRLQYSQLANDQVEPEKKILFQMSFAIGAHPAHSY